MRPSFPIWGVKGLFPLIAEKCPQAIHYPQRFSGLAGSRVAIDATLLVHRLHYVDDPHESRHLLGFYRLISALRADNIRAIMIFDHPESRLPQKAREQQKRRNQKLLVRLRNKIELRRNSRLQELASAVAEFETCSLVERAQISRLLAWWAGGDKSGRSAVRESSQSPPSHPLPYSSIVHSDVEAADWSIPASESHEIGRSLAPHISEVTLASSRTPAFGAPLSSPPRIEDLWELWDYVVEQDGMDSGVSQDVWNAILEAKTSRALVLALRLDRLRRDFELSREESHIRGVSIKETAEQTRLNALEATVYDSLAKAPTASFGPLVTALEAPFSESDETIQEVVSGPAAASGLASAESNAQASSYGNSPQSTAATDASTGEMTEDPGATPLGPNASATDATSAKPSDVPIDSVPSLKELEARSAILSEQYRKASAALPLQTYTDCAALSELMDVPVLWTSDGSRSEGRMHEAEALASALVRQGYADYVATEDTDVIVYGVPMLRNLTGNKRKLTLIDSALARDALFPSSENASECSTIASHSPTATSGVTSAAQEISPAAAGKREHHLSSEEKLLDFALLCGTDFNRTLPGVGPKTALRLIQQHGSIANLMRLDPKKYASPPGVSNREYRKELNAARRVFANPPSTRFSVSKLLMFRAKRSKTSLERRLREQNLVRSDIQSARLPPETATKADPLPIYDRVAVTDFLRLRGIGPKAMDDQDVGAWYYSYNRGSRNGHDVDDDNIPASFGRAPYNDGTGAPIAVYDVDQEQRERAASIT